MAAQGWARPRVYRENDTCGCADCGNYEQSYNPSAIHNQSCGCDKCGNYGQASQMPSVVAPPAFRGLAAGQFLGRHISAVFHQLSDGTERIKAKADPLDRWLSFVAWKDGFNGTSGSGHDNTGPEKISWTSRSIDDIALASKRLCEDCRNSESFL